MLTRELIEELAMIARRGSEQAADALGRLTGHAITVHIDAVRSDRLDSICDKLAPCHQPCIGLVARLQGALEGNLALVLGEPTARQLIADLNPGAEPAADAYDDYARSILREVANIALSTYINSLGAHLARYCLPGPPDFVRDLGGAIAAGLLLETAAHSDAGLVFTTRMEDATGARCCHLLFIPSPTALPLLMEGLSDDRGE
ncbi:MAG: hypothetical protein ACOCZK_03640 [Planctomycetota bacterium]